MPLPDDTEPPDNTHEAFLDILAHFHETEQARLESAKNTLRTEILPGLIQHRVANIEAAYSGYGDSGAIDGVQYRDAAGTRIDRAEISQELKESLEACLYEFLPQGFEINEGSQGTLTIDVQANRISVQHQENYTATSESSQEFPL